MADEEFFEELTEQSRVKITIVQKYFKAWAKITSNQSKQKNQKYIGYIDLFCGPGSYKDGEKSTPLIILETAINDPDLRSMLLTLFNDKEAAFVQILQDSFIKLPNNNLLQNQPLFVNGEVGKDIVKYLKTTKFTSNGKLIPSLFFVDPWGYKGLTLDLLNETLKNWGCDCIFFFNYNRIRPGLSNPKVKEHMNALFGQQRADILRRKISNMSPSLAELTIIEEFSQAFLQDGKYVLPFRFKDSQEKRTSHHLIFISKNFTAYNIMKEIMAEGSSKAVHGVASFEYDEATAQQASLFQFNTPLEELENMLLKEFDGQKIIFADLYKQHSVGKPYIKKNYKELLLRLEEEDKIQIESSNHNRKIGTLGDNVELVFIPSKKPKQQTLFQL